MYVCMYLCVFMYLFDWFILKPLWHIDKVLLGHCLIIFNQFHFFRTKNWEWMLTAKFQCHRVQRIYKISSLFNNLLFLYYPKKLDKPKLAKLTWNDLKQICLMCLDYKSTFLKPRDLIFSNIRWKSVALFSSTSAMWTHTFIYVINLAYRRSLQSNRQWSDNQKIFTGKKSKNNKRLKRQPWYDALRPT